MRLHNQCNLLLVKTIKTVNSSPNPPVSSNDNKKHKKQTRTRQKTVKINAGISEHDLDIKITHVSEWLEKGYHVSVLILKTANKVEVNLAESDSVNLYTSGTFCRCISE